MTDQAEYIHQGRLNGSQRNKVKGLLDMLYTPREFSLEIGINQEQVYRVYIPAGCPHHKDRRGRILINGKAFKDWYGENYQKRILDKDQAYCVSCKKIFRFTSYERKQKGNLVYYSLVCPLCGRNAIRFIDCKRKKDDQ